MQVLLDVLNLGLRGFLGIPHLVLDPCGQISGATVGRDTHRCGSSPACLEIQRKVAASYPASTHSKPGHVTGFAALSRSPRPVPLGRPRRTTTNPRPDQLLLPAAGRTPPDPPL